MKEQDLFKNAVIAMAKDVPNSVLADLLSILSEDSVVKIVEGFSGEDLKIPRIEDVWRIYRNKIIKDTLSKKNSKLIKQRLSEHFGIGTDAIQQIYNSERVKEYRIRPKVVDRSIKRIVASKQEDVLKKFREALLIKSGKNR